MFLFLVTAAGTNIPPGGINEVFLTDSEKREKRDVILVNEKTWMDEVSATDSREQSREQNAQ